MKFEYTLLDRAFKRPYATLQVGSAKGSRKYKVLIDSGADVNVFSASLADRLGIVLEEGELMSVRGATGAEATFYKHPISITVAGITFETRAAFADVPHLELAGLAGQEGFFEHFLITFDAENGEFELAPKRI